MTNKSAITVRVYFDDGEVHDLQAVDEKAACKSAQDVAKSGMFVKGEFEEGFMKYYPPCKISYAVLIYGYDDGEDDDDDIILNLRN